MEVTSLPWGPTSDGTLIYRNMLPERAFPQAIQFAKPTDEVATMGDYFPVSRYYSHSDPLTDQEVTWTLEHFWSQRPPNGYSETF